jgi:hypothetical protein
MKHGLLVLAAVLALAIGVPASAQYMFIDVNGDGVNTTADVLTPSTTGVDIYLMTNMALSDPNNYDSAVVPSTCNNGPYPLTINSYTIILTAPNGGVTYGAWHDNMNFTIDVGNGKAGNDDLIGWAAATILNPGTYKLGHLDLTVSGSNSYITFAAATSISPTAITSFGSQCIGLDFDNTMKYPQDWTSIGPTRSGIPVTETTWGKIKSLYSH